MRVLVTGATGFLGSNLAFTLAEQGHTVRALVRNPAKAKMLQGHKLDIVDGNLNDPASLEKAAAGMEIVFNNAGMVADWGKRETFYRVNVAGTRNLLEACLAAGTKRFVHASSVTVLGIPRDLSPMSESTPYTQNHFEYYTETKIASEKLVLQYHRQRGLPCVIIRPGLIWGPGDTTILPHIKDLALRGLLYNIGRGQNDLCLVYIAHVVRAMTLAAEVPQALGQVYNIVDAEKHTSRDFLYGLTQAMGIKPPARALPFPLLYASAWFLEMLSKLLRRSQAPFLTRYGLCLLGCHYNFDITKAKRELGYSPSVSFCQGMRNIAARYQNGNK